MPPDNSGSDHFAITKNWRALANGSGPGSKSCAGKGDAVSNLDHAAGMDQADHQRCETFVKSPKIRFAPNGRETLAIDG